MKAELADMKYSPGHYEGPKGQYYYRGIYYNPDEIKPEIQVRRYVDTDEFFISIINGGKDLLGPFESEEAATVALRMVDTLTI